VGRIAPRKGIEHLIRALPRVRKRVPDARLVVVGGPAEPEDHVYLASLRQEVAVRGLEDVVDFRGPAEDVAAALDAFSVLGFVSPVDIAPITVLEAMSRGVPIVSASDGGAEDMVVDGETGFRVEPRDDERIADRIADVLCNPALRMSMAAAARERFERGFGPAAYRDRLERLYRDLHRP
jgi:phosphatidylinositol alpha-1,6-mannosyltransferase